VKIFHGLDEFIADEGGRLGPTDGLDVDHERAAVGPVGATIAPGLLTLSLLLHFMQELYRVDNVAMAINQGVKKVRFIPVHVIESIVRYVA
jgi:acyl dehydratase